MSEIKNRDYILEAIDQLRRRKARPDIQRICNFVTRRFSVDSKDTKIDLQRCVEKEIVYKVEYKGSISYRNAARKSYGTIKRDTMTQQEINILKSDTKQFASVIISAVADLILVEPDYLDLGVPQVELVKKILAMNPQYNKKILGELLQKEVENGGLIRMESGNLALGPSNRSREEGEAGEQRMVMGVMEEVGRGPMKVKKKPGPKPGKKKAEALEKLKAIEGQNIAAVRLGVRRKVIVFFVVCSLVGWGCRFGGVFVFVCCLLSFISNYLFIDVNYCYCFVRLLMFIYCFLLFIFLKCLFILVFFC